MQGATGDHPGLFGSLARWWRNWTALDAAAGEPGCCDREEATHIARDARVSVSELRTLPGRWPDTPHVLERRLAACGSSVERIAHSEPQVVRDLERVRGQCDVDACCEQDLDKDEHDRRGVSTVRTSRRSTPCAREIGIAGY